jgi:hypothetical protein
MKYIKSKPAYNPQNLTKATYKTSHCLVMYYAHAYYALSFIILIWKSNIFKNIFRYVLIGKVNKTGVGALS